MAHLQHAHQDLDKELSPSERATCRAFAALVQLALEPASDYALWCDAEAPRQQTWVSASWWWMNGCVDALHLYKLTAPG